MGRVVVQTKMRLWQENKVLVLSEKNKEENAWEN